MPHKCAVCSKIYENYAVELMSGCQCGSKIFVYLKTAPAQAKKSMPSAAPGPAAKIEKIVDEVTATIKDLKKSKKSKINFDMDTIKVIEDGVYDININKILNNEPIIIEIKEDGKYFIHLASVFKEKSKNNLEKEHLDISLKKQAK